MYYMLDMLTCLYNNLSILGFKLGCLCCSNLVQYTCTAVPFLILSLNSTKAQVDTEHRFGWHEFFIIERERERERDEDTYWLCNFCLAASIFFTHIFAVYYFGFF